MTDTRVGFEAVERLIKARGGNKRGFQVQAGESDSDSMAWSSVLSQMGRSYGDGIYGNYRGY